jgi:hypothetical protein
LPTVLGLVELPTVLEVVLEQLLIDLEFGLVEWIVVLESGPVLVALDLVELRQFDYFDGVIILVYSR